MRLLLRALALASAIALPAHAQMYKCTHGEKVTYSEAPCARGAQTLMAPPDPPVSRPEPAELARLQQQSAQLEAARHAREAREDYADALHDQRAARRREHCTQLQLARKWAEDDVRRASHRTIDTARIAARRAAERHAAACK
ncbi:DUF4124 domain-containing protein [Pseudoduganella albidiflava]|uniref:DUF4124 domain-containing protein n=1 Tax=Pseudoduganella albidiflava TaxID=321983 RepID=A0A411WYK3_9BURK|nr:DUF4124 domain-containing protein [Pseudoduganella albidiflava]QBI01787.1 DUF4124 domain-containing protein [Pseudoduganella albidiflava]GGY39741.1 hypothetical protein GCM10007387_22270 [Pseudoduganella albidiflava]